MANGECAPRDLEVYRAPHRYDTLAFFLLWHLVPQRPRASPHSVHDDRFRTAAMELFSVEGWYNWLVSGGEYHLVPSRHPIRYPYPTDDISPVHVAAWFAVHGVGRDEQIIHCLERWGRRARNQGLGRTPDNLEPWPTKPRDLASVTTPAHSALVVKFDDIAWGEVLAEEHTSNVDDYGTDLLEDE